MESRGIVKGFLPPVARPPSMVYSRTMKSGTPEERSAEHGADAPAAMPVDGCLDLHAFAPRDVTSVVEEYLRECRRRGITAVRIIHGKGTGFQREAVRALLAKLDMVESFHAAPPEAGGWGATLVNLRRRRGDSP